MRATNLGDIGPRVGGIRPQLPEASIAPCMLGPNQAQSLSEETCRLINGLSVAATVAAAVYNVVYVAGLV